VFTDVHHIELRSEDGSHHVENLVTLCGAHHAAVHEGRIILAGTASQLHVVHADGTPYGGAVGAAVADVRAKAFRALRALGFRESDAKGALARIPKNVASLETLVRQALREVAPQ
jgi:hypothetical protein